MASAASSLPRRFFMLAVWAFGRASLISVQDVLLAQALELSPGGRLMGVGKRYRAGDSEVALTQTPVWSGFGIHAHCLGLGLIPRIKTPGSSRLYEICVKVTDRVLPTTGNPWLSLAGDWPSR